MIKTLWRNNLALALQYCCVCQLNITSTFLPMCAILSGGTEPALQRCCNVSLASTGKLEPTPQLISQACGSGTILNNTHAGISERPVCLYQPELHTCANSRGKLGTHNLGIINSNPDTNLAGKTGPAVLVNKPLGSPSVYNCLRNYEPCGRRETGIV